MLRIPKGIILPITANRPNYVMLVVNKAYGTLGVHISDIKDVLNTAVFEVHI